MAMDSGESPKIGIALSGGGSRAMAFHLGCLRTLHRLGILQRARVLSTVSGGSVIGAMYAVHEGTFDEFEHRVRSVLQAGFAWPALRTAFTTSEGLKAVLSFLLLLLTWIWLTPLRFVAQLVSRIATNRRQGEVGAVPEKWMPRRFASRTTILRRAFDDLLFRGKPWETSGPTGRGWSPSPPNSVRARPSISRLRRRVVIASARSTRPGSASRKRSLPRRPTRCSSPRSTSS